MIDQKVIVALDYDNQADALAFVDSGRDSSWVHSAMEPSYNATLSKPAISLSTNQSVALSNLQQC